MKLVRPVLVAAVLAVAACAASDPMAFFKATEGSWHGRSTTTTIGPLVHMLNLTVLPSPYKENQWLFYRTMASPVTIDESWQWFWADNDVRADTGNMTYCALLKNWVYPATPAAMAIPFTRTRLTETSAQWAFDLPYFPEGQGFNGTWTLTLADNNTKLHSYVEISGAVHVDAWHTRVAEPRHRALVQEVRAVLPPPRASSDPYGPNGAICLQMPHDGTFAPVTTTAAPSMPAPLDVAASATATAAQLCPLGFTGDKMPDFVAERLAAKKKKAAAVAAAPGGRTYENCFVINPAMGVTVRWTWNTTTKAIDVLASARRQEPGALMTQRFFALGILPEWPLMRGMDIALGFVDPAYGQGCVQNLYAAARFGAPANNTQQTLSDTTSWLSGDQTTLYLQFTRPWATGHHNLSTYGQHRSRTLGYEVAFATGSMTVGSTCDAGRPSYHGPERGVYAIDWAHPSAMNQGLRC